jgi:quinol monooxygenase YgiN
MPNDIYWTCEFRIEPSKFGEFKKVVRSVVASTERESGCLAYEYSVSGDHTVIHIIERYRDSAAVAEHLQNFSRFAEAFNSLATVGRFQVYGDPNAEVRQMLAAAGAIYNDRFDGFTR